MKKQISILSFVLGIAILGFLFYSKPALALNTQTPDTTQNVTVGAYSSIAIDSCGNPHISYYDATNTALKYASYSLIIGWSTVTVDNPDDTDVGKWSSIAIDTNGDIHISYYDATNGELKYAKYSLAAWNTGFVTTKDNDVGTNSSLALSSDNKPRISYYDKTNSSLEYAYCNSNCASGVGNWTKMNDKIETLNFAYVVPISLKLDGNNYPAILYNLKISDPTTVFYLKYAYCPGGGGETSSPDDCSTDGNWTKGDIASNMNTSYNFSNRALALAGSSPNAPRISYGGNSEGLMYA